MRCVSRRVVGCLALMLAFTAGGCASLDESAAGRVAPPMDTGSGKTGGSHGGGGGGGY